MLYCLTVGSSFRAGATGLQAARKRRHRTGWQASIILLVCLVCGACGDRRVIDTKSLRLAPSQWTRINTGTLKIKSSFADICIPLPDGYTMPSHGARVTIHDRNGQPIRLSERFISANAAPENGDGPWSLYNGRVERACFSNRSDTTGHEYTAIELKSSDTLTVRAIEWETGKRYGAP